MKWWLFLLAFLLGAVLTWIYIVRRATREVRIVERTPSDELEGADEYDDEYDEVYDDESAPAAAPSSLPAAGVAAAAGLTGAAVAATAAEVRSPEVDITAPRTPDPELDVAPVTLPRVAEPAVAAPVMAGLSSATTDDDLLDLDGDVDDLDLPETVPAGLDLDGGVDLDAPAAVETVLPSAPAVDLDAGGVDLDAPAGVDLDAPGVVLETPGAGLDLDAPAAGLDLDATAVDLDAETLPRADLGVGAVDLPEPAGLDLDATDGLDLDAGGGLDLDTIDAPAGDLAPAASVDLDVPGAEIDLDAPADDLGLATTPVAPPVAAPGTTDDDLLDLDAVADEPELPAVDLPEAPSAGAPVSDATAATSAVAPAVAAVSATAATAGLLDLDDPDAVLDLDAGDATAVATPEVAVDEPEVAPAEAPEAASVDVAEVADAVTVVEPEVVADEPEAALAGVAEVADAETVVEPEVVADEPESASADATVVAVAEPDDGPAPEVVAEPLASGSSAALPVAAVAAPVGLALAGGVLDLDDPSSTLDAVAPAEAAADSAETAADAEPPGEPPVAPTEAEVAEESVAEPEVALAEAEVTEESVAEAEVAPAEAEVAEESLTTAGAVADGPALDTAEELAGEVAETDAAPGDDVVGAALAAPLAVDEVAAEPSAAPTEEASATTGSAAVADDGASHTEEMLDFDLDEAGGAPATAEAAPDATAVAVGAAGLVATGVADAPAAAADSTGSDASEAAVTAATAGVVTAGAAVAAIRPGRYAGSAEPEADGSGPEGWEVKGNEDSMLFHTPASPSYKRTKAEVWFETESAAEAAGFTRWDAKSKASVPAPVAALPAPPPGKYGAGSADPEADGSGPEGWEVKGNEDSMLFHTPASPSYKRTKAEVWFETEAAAEAAGFTRWDAKSKASVPAPVAAPPAPAAAPPAPPAPAPGKYGAGSADPEADGSGPEGWEVKGNEDSMLFHTPASPSYKRTKAEVWFETESAAEAAGFTRWDSRAKAAAPAALAATAPPPGKYGPGSADPGPRGKGPEGWEVKGNEDSMLFHTPESPWYKRTRAEVWFVDVETARAAGFEHWDPDQR